MATSDDMRRVLSSIDKKAVVSVPDDNKSVDATLRLLSLPQTPADIVIDPRGRVTFVSMGDSSLRAAWHWVKYGRRLDGPLEDDSAK